MKKSLPLLIFISFGSFAMQQDDLKEDQNKEITDKQSEEELDNVILKLVKELNDSTSVDAHCRYVLTGGPGVGKSEVINLLQQQGYQTIPEVWTLLFNEAKQNNNLKYFSAASNSVAFRKKLMKMQLSFENKLDKKKSAFLDRSTVDVVAFGNIYNITMPQNITNIPKEDRYDLIFFIDPLPKNLYQKTELCSQEESLKIHQQLKEFYTDMGYPIVEVPFDSLKKRMAFILNTIASSNNKYAQ